VAGLLSRAAFDPSPRPEDPSPLIALAAPRKAGAVARPAHAPAPAAAAAGAAAGAAGGGTVGRFVSLAAAGVRGGWRPTGCAEPGGLSRADSDDPEADRARLIGAATAAVVDVEGVVQLPASAPAGGAGAVLRRATRQAAGGRRGSGGGGEADAGAGAGGGGGGGWAEEGEWWDGDEAEAEAEEGPAGTWRARLAARLLRRSPPRFAGIAPPPSPSRPAAGARP
jgi:hypothetical protein